MCVCVCVCVRVSVCMYFFFRKAVPECMIPLSILYHIVKSVLFYSTILHCKATLGRRINDLINGVLGHDSTVRLFWAGDNLGE